MNIQIILIIIGLLIIFFLAFKLLKGILKAAITVGILLLVIVITSGIIIYNDAVTLKQGLEEENMIIITNENQVVTAFKTTADVPITSIIDQEFYETITDEELNEIKEKIDNEEYDEIDQEKFLLIIDQELFYDKETQIMDIETTLSEQTLIDFAESTTKEEAIQALNQNEDLQELNLEFYAGIELTELKSQLYYNLIMQEVKETKGTMIIQGIKDKQITTRPQLISITVLNIFPERIMQGLTQQLNQEGE